MKKLTLLFCTVVLFSCHKEINQKEDNRLYNVKIGIADFSPSIEPFNARVSGDSLGSYFHFLSLVVFENGVGQEPETYTSDMPDFGQLSINLPSGTYDIVVLGSQKQVVGLDFGNSATFYMPGGDAFYGKKTVTVNGDVNTEISMERIMARLNVTITDTIPADVRKIIITAKNPPDSAYPYMNNVMNLLTKSMKNYEYAMTATYNFPADTVRTGVVLQSFLPAPSPTSIILWITAIDAANDTVMYRSIPNVPLLPNRTTVLAGHLFDTSNVRGTLPYINNPSFGADSVVVF